MVDQVVLTGDIIAGSKLGSGGWKTAVSESKAGTEQRVKFRPFPRRPYEYRLNLGDPDAVEYFQTFFNERNGMAVGFLIKDISHVNNYQLTDHLILTATGGETTAQIKRVWGSANQLSRTIRYIDAGTLIVKKNDVTLTLTTDYTVNSTGLISFVSALSASDEINVSCLYYTPVRFDVDEFFVVPTAENTLHAKTENIPLIEVLE